MSVKSRPIRLNLPVMMVSTSRHWAFFIWTISFCVGMLFGRVMWMFPVAKVPLDVSELNCNNLNSIGDTKSMNNRSRDHDINLGHSNGSSTSHAESQKWKGKKYLMVVGINTTFSSELRRKSLRETWFPDREKRMKLEEEKGIVVRFVIGHSSTSGGSVLDKSIQEEDEKYRDFLRLEHVEAYDKLSSKTKTYFSTVVDLWDADFYVKVDDDVHLNIGSLANILVQHLNKPRVYIGCMKSGPVIFSKEEKYYEEEYWKFGGKDNNYFRHATGQIYAISNELATYIAKNKEILHKYANEDVTLGSWLIGLEVDNINERRLCCSSSIERRECEFREIIGLTCVATFDWTCSGICESTKRIKQIHQRCGEDENVLWSAYA